MGKKREDKVEVKEEVKEVKKGKTQPKQPKEEAKAQLKFVETSQSGGVCVDPEYEYAKECDVLPGANGEPLSCHLNFTDLEKNSNKFHIF
jgi:hypothetical protein